MKIEDRTLPPTPTLNYLWGHVQMMPLIEIPRNGAFSIYVNFPARNSSKKDSHGTSSRARCSVREQLCLHASQFTSSCCQGPRKRPSSTAGMSKDTKNNLEFTLLDTLRAGLHYCLGQCSRVNVAPWCRFAPRLQRKR